jgi:hypothetical protein
MNRFFYLAASALFLFFLISSAPHLVHHSFNQSQATPCLAFSIAKGCHLKLASAINLPVIDVAIEGIPLSFEVWIPYLTPSPFSQRAPPLF